MREGLTGAAGCGPAPVSFDFYLDVYGGVLTAEAFADALSAAVRCVGALTGVRDVRNEWDEDVADAWRRAVCAAADTFAEYGEGRVGGFSIGSFSVTNYRDEGTTGAEVAREAALAELAPTLPSLLISSILCTPIIFLPGLPSSEPKQRQRRSERWWSARACSNPKVFRAHSRKIPALKPANKTLLNTHEVGSIHTVQGYDLNYGFIIIGNDLMYDASLDRLVVNRPSFKDRGAKKTATDEMLESVAINAYYVLLTRGMKGTYIYACDPEVKRYFQRFIPTI